MAMFGSSWKDESYDDRPIGRPIHDDDYGLFDRYKDEESKSEPTYNQGWVDGREHTLNQVRLILDTEVSPSNIMRRIKQLK